MLPVLGFMKYLAKFQKLGLMASNLPAIFFEGLPTVFLEGSLSRFSWINAQYFMNLFPKAAKIAHKIFFMALLIIKLISFTRFFSALKINLCSKSAQNFIAKCLIKKSGTKRLQQIVNRHSSMWFRLDRVRNPEHPFPG